MMISALKTTADRIADSRRAQVHHVQDIQLWECPGKHRGNNGEILGHVVRDGKCGERTASNQKLLADFDDFDELCRIGIEVHHVAGFLGGLGAGIHGHADVRLRKRRGVVGAIASHGHEFALGLLALDQRHLVFGLGLGQEIVDPGLAGDGGGRQRIVTGDHHGANSHGAKLVETLFHAALDDVGKRDGTEHEAVLANE